LLALELAKLAPEQELVFRKDGTTQFHKGRGLGRLYSKSPQTHQPQAAQRTQSESTTTGRLRYLAIDGSPAVPASPASAKGQLPASSRAAQPVPSLPQKASTHFCVHQRAVEAAASRNPLANNQSVGAQS